MGGPSDLPIPFLYGTDVVRARVGAHVVITVVAGLVFGPRWFDRGDPFDVYSAIVARLSTFVRDGRRNLHHPLDPCRPCRAWSHDLTYLVERGQSWSFRERPAPRRPRSTPAARHLLGPPHVGGAVQRGQVDEFPHDVT